MRDSSLAPWAHRITSLLFVVAISLTMACAPGKAQSGSGAPITPVPPMKQTIYAPISGIDDFSQWTLELVNRSNLPIPSLLTVFSPSGKTLASSTILLGGEETQRIDVKALIPPNQRWATLGGVNLEFIGGAMAVAGQITLSNYHGFGNIDSTLVPDMMFMSNSADAVWWVPEGGRSFLILGNSSDQPIQADVVYGSGHHRTLEIPPRGTAIEPVWHDEDEDKDGREGPRIQSVHVSGGGMPGTLRVTGYVASLKRGFLDTIRAYDPDLSTESAIYANGLHFSDDSRHLTVKNLYVGPIIVSGTIYPLSSGGPEKLVSLPQKFLEANQSAELKLPEFEDPEALDGAALKLESSGPKGSLVATYTSFDHNNQITRSVPFKDLGDSSIVTGGYPWRLDGNYQSNVYITNVGAKRATYGAYIRPAGSVRYVVGLRDLEPGETTIMDIGRIRDQQIPDQDGRTLPKNVQFGEVQWFPVFSNGPSHLIGRTYVVNRSSRVDSSFSCGGCPCSPNATAGYTTPSSVTVSARGTASIYAYLSWHDPCQMNSYPDTAFAPSSWLTSPGYVSLTTGTSPSTLTGVSAGSQSFSAPYSTDVYIYNPEMSPNCAYQGPQTVYAGGNATVKPVLNSISPAMGAIGATVPVTLNGNGLSGSSVNAGSGITVTVNSSTKTQIQATFAISASAAAGNHAVSVTANGQSSGTLNFFVQVPAKLVFFNTVCAPNGQGPLQVITNGSVVDCGGATRATNFCGVNKNLTYQLVDQSASRNPFPVAYALTESFSNLSTTNPALGLPTPSKNVPIPANGYVTDAQYVGFTYPNCLASNDHHSYTQNFSATVGGVTYPLSTTVSISNGKFSGTAQDNVSITTP